MPAPDAARSAVQVISLMWLLIGVLGGIPIGMFLFWLLIVTTKTYH
jgi:hypothetical protein